MIHSTIACILCTRILGGPRNEYVTNTHPPIFGNFPLNWCPLAPSDGPPVIRRSVYDSSVPGEIVTP